MEKISSENSHPLAARSEKEGLQFVSAACQLKALFRMRISSSDDLILGALGLFVFRWSWHLKQLSYCNFAFDEIEICSSED